MLHVLSNEFIQEQIHKCREKISIRDYDGAITNARSLVEEVLKEILKKASNEEPKNNGKLNNLYNEAKKVLNLTKKDTYARPLLKLLEGLGLIVDGLADLSNNMSDRHARKYTPHKHHAKLAVNTALIFSDFLFESWDYQKQSNKKTV